MNIQKILEEYLKIYPEEANIQKPLKDFLKDNIELSNPKSSKGHMTAMAIVYCENLNSILLLQHKDLNVWLAPGGHSELNDTSMLETAIRELKEETGLTNLKCVSMSNNILVPLDINSHLIPKSDKKNMPEHYHHDFRYLFIIENEKEIKIDDKESNSYIWVNINELNNDKIFGVIVKKIKNR